MFNFKRFFIFLFFLILIASCRKDREFSTSKVNFKFSKDTIFFDTVFTKLPGSPYPRSINKRFIIRNPENKLIKFNAKLMGGSSSVYRINVDGFSGTDIKDIEIRPNDSLWVFVEATLEPNNTNNKILIRDSILFENNNNTQFVQLAAYGWDAYYFKDTVLDVNTTFLLNDKPYVIVNNLFVNENVTLTIEKGVHFYCTPNSYIVIRDTLYPLAAMNILGTLKINGTKEQPVVFEGDRLDASFNNTPGQWRGLHFFRKSINNEINHCIIKNATIGIRVDSLPETGLYNLILNKTIIQNISAYGILGITAKINMENSVIANCGSNTLLGFFGGFYKATHCTFYSGSGRRDPHVLLNNVRRNENKQIVQVYPVGFDFYNCIIHGNSETELGFDFNLPNAASPSVVVGTLLKSKTTFTSTGMIFNQDPLFNDISKLDLSLKENSPCKNTALPAFQLPDDIKNKTRDAQPDMGAYEF